MGKDFLKKMADWKGLAFIAAGTLFFVLFFLKPMTDEQSKKNTALKSKVAGFKTEKKSLEQFVAALSKQGSEEKIPLPEKKQDVKARILTGQLQPSLTSIAPFLATLSTPTFREGVLIKAINHVPTTLGTGYESTAYKIYAAGAFQKMIRFMDKISKLDTLATIDTFSLSLNKGDTGNIGLDVNMELEGRLYHLRADARPLEAKPPENGDQK